MCADFSPYELIYIVRKILKLRIIFRETGDNLPLLGSYRILADRMRQVDNLHILSILFVCLLWLQVMGGNLLIDFGQMPELHDHGAKLAIVETQMYLLQIGNRTFLGLTLIEYLDTEFGRFQVHDCMPHFVQQAESEKMVTGRNRTMPRYRAGGDAALDTIMPEGLKIKYLLRDG